MVVSNLTLLSVVVVIEEDLEETQVYLNKFVSL